MSRIVRILKVIDTRDYEEVDDRWVPIPGSGLSNTCARCGRSHEVHASVVLDDGSEIVVGTGCMRADEADVASRVKTATSAAKTAARLRAELVAHNAELAVYQRAVAEVAALPLPPAQRSEKAIVGSAPIQVMTMGDAEVWCHFAQGEEGKEERSWALVNAWRNNRLRERGFKTSPQPDRDLERRLARAEARSKGPR